MENYKDILYTIFRVLVGLMFLQHGLQKLFGALGGNAAPLISQMGLAGIIELVVGILLIIGVLTRSAATLGALLMLAAYVMVHFSNGLWPIQNGGELAVMFFAAFLALIAHGPGRYTLQKWLTAK